jgi:hypothetical protein
VSFTQRPPWQLDAIRRNDSGGREILLLARVLPGLVAGMGLRHIGGQGDFSVLQGGSPVAEFFSLTAEQIRERITGSRELSADRLDEALGLLKSPDFWPSEAGAWRCGVNTQDSSNLQTLFSHSVDGNDSNRNR